ncbi:MAG: MFS transporter, partial [Planctomycetes bacterium]|nr:MFS transporter [Planctomycetota bacterium]
PLANYLIDVYGISGSFIGLGIFFAVVVIIAGQLLSWPDEGYVAPAPPVADAPGSPKDAPGSPKDAPGSPKDAPGSPNDATGAPPAASDDWSAGAMVQTVQFYALVFLFFGSAQSGLLVIGNATQLLKDTAKNADAAIVAFFAVNAWILSAYGGFVNAVGRVGTGSYSDRIGRRNAYLINGAVSAVCLFVTPWIMQTGSVTLLFIAIGVAYWQYGGGLALLPAFTADFFGAKNLGFNYGLVFLGWGLAFAVSQIAGYIEDLTGSLDYAFYLSGGLLILALGACLATTRPSDSPRAA